MKNRKNKFKSFLIKIVIIICFVIAFIEMILGFLTLSLYQRIFPVGASGKLLKFIDKYY